MSETNRIEYKRELTSELDIEKEVVAFLNYKEGGSQWIEEISEKLEYMVSYAISR